MRWLKLSIGFAVTAGFVWLLAREVDLDALGQAFAGDALRVLDFLRQLRAPTMAVAGTLVVERIPDVAVLTALPSTPAM